MSVTFTPFKRHSRAQGVTLIDAARSRPSTTQELSPPPPTLSKEGAHRRSRALNVRQTPSWISSERGLAVSSKADTFDSVSEQAQHLATSPRLTEAAVVPTLTWVDCVKLGTLVQGGRELLICCNRDNQRLFMLKDVGCGVKTCVDRIGMLQHRHIALASFVIDTETTSYVAFAYTRYTLEELLHIHVTMNESHIRAVALPVRSAARSPTQQII
jgi:hypothetical protein